MLISSLLTPAFYFRTLVARLNLGSSLLAVASPPQASHNAPTPSSAPPAATASFKTAPTPPPAATEPTSHVSVRPAALPKLKPLKFGMKSRAVPPAVEEMEVNCSPPIQFKEIQEVDLVEAGIQLVDRPSPMSPLPLPAAAPSTIKLKPWQSRFNLRMPGKPRLPSPSLPPMDQPSQAAKVAQLVGKSPAPSQTAAGSHPSSLEAVLAVQLQPTAAAPPVGSPLLLQPTQPQPTGLLQPQPNATFQPQPDVPFQPQPTATLQAAYPQPQPSGPPALASCQPQASGTPQPQDQPQPPEDGGVQGAGAGELAAADQTRINDAASTKSAIEDCSVFVTQAGVTKDGEVAAPASPKAPASPEGPAAPTAAKMLLSPGTALSDEKRNAALKKVLQSPFPSQPERQASLFATPEEGGAADQAFLFATTEESGAGDQAFGFNFGGEASSAENSFSFFGGGGEGAGGRWGGWLLEMWVDLTSSIASIFQLVQSSFFCPLTLFEIILSFML